MDRWITPIAAVVVSAASVVMIAGCSSNAYDPHAEPTKLSSYAATSKYPASAPTEPAKDISFSVAGDGTITVTNASDASLGTFDMWVNKQYVLQVNKLDAKTKVAFAPSLFYNSTASNLTTVKPDGITLVELAEGGKLMVVAGPVKE